MGDRSATQRWCYADGRAPAGVRRVAATASVGLCVLAAAAAPPAAAGVPRGFVGMNIDGPALEPTTRVPAQLRHMARSGVQSVRWTIDWPTLQPYGSWSHVP